MQGEKYSRERSREVSILEGGLRRHGTSRTVDALDAELDRATTISAFRRNKRQSPFIFVQSTHFYLTRQQREYKDERDLLR